MRRILLTILLCPLAVVAMAQKRIYIPEDLRDMNLESDTSKWCWRRSAETRDLIFMWERGFGHDLQQPPQLEGQPMAFNLSVLMDRVQSFYTFFRDSLGWVRAGQPSKADTYKMMVMVMYSLDGTAYGGTYDNYIGGLWVSPNRIQDKTMNCMAHELGHSFQTQIMADSIGDCWGGSGFFEMTSQWMLWQVNPHWLRDENYHFEAFKQLTHKAFLDMENIYHSPFVIQWWSDLHGPKSIAELFRQGRVGEDPVMTYRRMYNLTQPQFNDEMLRGYQHLMNFDFKHARKETRPYACTFSTELDTLKGHWLQPKNAPEAYGFNAIRLPVNQKRVRVEVQGRDVSFAFVGVTVDGQSVYGKPNDPVFNAPKGQALRHLYLVVMGTPKTYAMQSSATYPYRFHIKH